VRDERGAQSVDDGAPEWVLPRHSGSLVLGAMCSVEARCDADEGR
jgi:hypothetical protein